MVWLNLLPLFIKNLNDATDLRTSTLPNKEPQWNKNPIKICCFQSIVRHETIYQYFKKMSREDDISNYTVIILTAWPTCLERKNCTSCIKEDNSSQVMYTNLLLI